MEDTLIGRAFQNIQVALMIVAQNGEIIRSNHANDQLFGYECGDLMGRSVSSVLPISDMADLAKLFPPPCARRGDKTHYRTQTEWRSRSCLDQTVGMG